MFKELLEALKEAKISLNDKEQAVKKIKSIIVALDLDVDDYRINQGHQIFQLDYISTTKTIYPIIRALDNTENSELEKSNIMLMLSSKIGSMMNKYHKALQNLIDDQIDTIDRLEDGYIPYTSLEDIELLKELVDKAKPKKPIEKELWHGGVASMCPECGYCLTNAMLPCDTYYKFCPECGQKIDWEEERE